MRESRKRIETISESRLVHVCGGMEPLPPGPLLNCGCHDDNPGAGDLTQNPPDAPNRDELETDW